jgi:FkbM family methyltransferase
VAVQPWRSAVLNHGVGAGVEHGVVLRGLGTLSTIVDIGANRGQFALVARRWSPGARIISFEPLPEPARVYRAVFRDDLGATVHQVAIGRDVGEAVIHVSGRDDSSSLLPIGSAQHVLFPGTEEVGTQRIVVARLVDYLPEETIDEPALLKLDVQGFELEALEGSESLLPRFAWIYAECSFVELYAGQALAGTVIAWLAERGFVLRGVYNMTYDPRGKAIQGDFLFGA